MIKIHTIELQKIFELIIQKLNNENIHIITFNNDLYRYIPTDNWNSFTNNDIETGSLFDDIEALKLLVNDKERPCTYVDFDRIASVLRAISEIQNPASGA